MLEVSRSLQLSPSSSKQQAPPDHHVDFIPTSAAADCCDQDDFMVSDSLLLDYIDFSCCDVPSFIFDTDGDILPDLEVDPTDQLLAEFSSPGPELQDDDAARLLQQQLIGDDDEAKLPPPPPDVIVHQDDERQRAVLVKDDDDDKKKHGGGDEQAAVSTTDDGGAAGSSSDTKSSAGGHSHSHSHSKKKPSAATGKNSNGGKRKVKVDWTPELHRRFVQAVEQLGIDKAVPSRILEIMGIECLTRHNIASHLQKYRSHRKHLMAREAEAATWAQKRHMYAAAAAVAGAPPRKDGPPWVVPATIGFPPAAAAAAMAQPPPPFCRPLHVWGHPPTPTAIEAAAAAAPPTMLPVWPRHLAPPRAWAPLDPATAAAYWQQQQYHHHNAAARKWGGLQQQHHQAPAPAVVTQGTPCVVPPPAMLPARFPLPPVLPHPHPTCMYTTRPPATTMVVPPPPPPPLTSKLAELQLHQLDAHPSKESIDAAIGDVLVKPWLPLPLGLKPPSLDSVMSELHRQGIPKIPPAGQQQRG